MPVFNPPQATWQMLRERAVFRSSAAEVAENVLRSVRVTSAPVPVFKILPALGVELYQASNLGSSFGLVDSTKTPPRVYVNANAAIVNQRFTAAHELGHVLLHESGQLHRDDTYAKDRDPREVEANEFAAHLLMPLWILEPVVVHSRMTTGDLAQHFNVSVSAMQWQLAKLL